MKLSNSKDTVKCMHDKGNGRCRENKGSRKNRLVKLFSLVLAAVLTATAAVGDSNMGTVKAGDDIGIYGMIRIIWKIL